MHLEMDFRVLLMPVFIFQETERQLISTARSHTCRLKWRSSMTKEIRHLHGISLLNHRFFQLHLPTITKLIFQAVHMYRLLSPDFPRDASTLCKYISSVNVQRNNSITGILQISVISTAQVSDYDIIILALYTDIMQSYNHCFYY